MDLYYLQNVYAIDFLIVLNCKVASNDSYIARLRHSIACTLDSVRLVQDLYLERYVLGHKYHLGFHCNMILMLLY